jgi:hypothetical protein
MQYALLYAEGPDALPYVPADDHIGEWVDDVEARGVSEYGERLRPAHDATTVRVRDGEVLVVDGPFSEAKEAIGGFDVIDVRDLDEAIEIASKHPVASFGRVEIRPFVQWPDAEPGARIVPDGFAERPPRGRRYLMLVVVDPTGERRAGGDDAGADAERTDDDPEAWVREMDGRGVRRFGEVLRPPSDATFVRRRDGEVLVTDGGFAESKEWVAGFDLIDVRDLAEAIEVAAKHPMARGGAIELRPTWPFDVHGDQVARAEREADAWARRHEPAAAAALEGATR